MRRALLLTILVLAFAVSAPLEDIGKFFNRQGFVVEKLGDRVVIDLGKGKAFTGERFAVLKEGKKVVHPVTGEVLGSVEEPVGEIEVVEVKDKFSVARIIRDEGIERGQKVKLSVKEVCYEGSEEGYFKVSSYVDNLKKGKNCPYVVKEFQDGFGVELKGKAVAFFEKPVVVQTQPYAREPEEFRVRARFVMSLPSLPLSADACNLTGKDKDYLAVLFENRIVFYEILPKEVVEYATLRLPSGYAVNLQCAPLESDKDVVLINMVSGTEASSILVKFVGGSPVIVRENIPFMMVVLDKEKAHDTFVGQRFDVRDLWGEVRKLELRGDDVVDKGNFDVPTEFRADSAVALGDLLAFTDRDGYLRVYKGEDLILSQPEFDGSYTTAELPGVYEDEDKYTFNVRHFTAQVAKRAYLGAVRNVRSPIYRFLDVTKFSEGELYLIVIDKKGIAHLKKLIGKRFEEAIQSVVRTRSGRLFVITGRTGTLPLQNRGDLFEVEIEPL